MGGKSGGGRDYSAGAYQNAYGAAQRGAGWTGALENQFTGRNAQYYDAGYAGWQAGRPQPQPVMPEFGFGFPEMPAYESSSSSSFEAQMQAQRDQLAQQEAERRMTEGRSRRDSAYRNYLDAAGSATDYVNNEISREMSNARLLGIDYNITDEMKSQRISDYFSTVWGEGQQGELEALIGEFGAPTGFGGFIVKRGDGGTYAGKEGSETSKGTSTGTKPAPASTFATDEDETLGSAKASILGV